MLGKTKLSDEKVVFCYFKRHLAKKSLKVLKKLERHTGIMLIFGPMIFIAFMVSWFYFYGLQAYIDDILFGFSISSLTLFFVKVVLTLFSCLFFYGVIPYLILKLLIKVDRIHCLSKNKKKLYWLLLLIQFSVLPVCMWVLNMNWPVYYKFPIGGFILLSPFLLKLLLGRILNMNIRKTQSFYSILFLILYLWILYLFMFVFFGVKFLNNSNTFFLSIYPFIMIYFLLCYWIFFSKNKQKKIIFNREINNPFSALLLLAIIILALIFINISSFVGLSGFYENISIKANRISSYKLIQAGFWGNSNNITGYKENLGSYSLNNDTWDLYNIFLLVNLGKFKIITSSPCASDALLINNNKPISLIPILTQGERCSSYFKQFKSQYNTTKTQYQNKHDNMTQYRTNMAEFGSLLWTKPGNFKKRAYELWRQSALLGDPFSQYTLGVLHWWGYKKVCQKSLSQSIYWFTLSAKQDYIPAMQALSETYSTKNLNLPLAYYWLFKASALGDGSAYKKIDVLRGLLTKKQLRKTELLINQKSPMKS